MVRDDQRVWSSAVSIGEVESEEDKPELCGGCESEPEQGEDRTEEEEEQEEEEEEAPLEAGLLVL